MKIVAIVVRGMNFIGGNVGRIIIASAIICDTIGSVIICMIFSLAHTALWMRCSVGKSVAGALAFITISLAHRAALFVWLIRWTNDNMVSDVPVIFVIAFS